MCKIVKLYCTEHKSYFSENTERCNRSTPTRLCTEIVGPFNTTATGRVTKTKKNVICDNCRTRASTRHSHAHNVENNRTVPISHSARGSHFSGSSTGSRRSGSSGSTVSTGSMIVKKGTYITPAAGVRKMTFAEKFACYAMT